ncbi:MAG: CPBP family intramembrane metalloprotease [Candidatus Hydrogenedentes bacterium]|nr:CPBP family intramembrane metalloprotease [Candidatus Hydrogenedentota bacterium]
MDRITKTRAISWTAATIITPLIIGWMGSGFYIGLWYAKTQHQGPPLPAVLARGIPLGITIGLWATVFLFWLAHRKRAAFSELFAASSLNLSADLLYGLCLGAVWVVIYGIFDVVAFRDMFVFRTDKALSLPATFSAGFCEEFLFRGFLFAVITRAGGGVKSQIAITSIAFGLAHVFWGPWGMLWTTGLGATFAVARVWRGNVWPAVAAHTVLNLCIEPALLNKAVSGGFG